MAFAYDPKIIDLRNTWWCGTLGKTLYQAVTMFGKDH